MCSLLLAHPCSDTRRVRLVFVCDSSTSILLHSHLSPWNTLSGGHTWLIPEASVQTLRRAIPSLLQTAVGILAMFPLNHMHTFMHTNCHLAF
jgi:hypothetical protein